MKQKNWIYRAIFILAITLAAIWIVFFPRRAPLAQDFTLDGIKQSLSQNINLGLDLKGGSHLVMKVDTDDYLKNLTAGNRGAVVNIAKDSNIAIGESVQVTDVASKKYQVSVPVTEEAKVADLIDAVKKKNIFANWEQTSSGNTISWNLPVAIQRDLGEQATEQVLKIVDSRINAFGVKEPTLQRSGSKEAHQILLQMPGVEDPERIKKTLSAEAKLSLMKVVSPPSPAPMQTYATEQEALQSIGGKNTDSKKVLPFVERDEKKDAAQPDAKKPPTKFVVVETPSIIDGNELRDASAYSERQGGSDYKISFSFKPDGAQKFGEWTGKNINNYMAVVLSDEVKSAAYIKSQIFDSGQIDGRFTKNSAEDLALTLKSGALPAKIEYQEERTVGPSLGADSIRSGVTASIGGLVLVMLFMLFYYRGSGINAVVALILNMLLTVAALIWAGSTLTLPGIAGLILGIGMAVDSNVLIFERIREELRLGIPVGKSVDLGFDRAFVTIIDTHITTIISSVILYLYGSGPIRGFAVTLILGLLINLFSAVFVSKTIFIWLLGHKKEVTSLSI